MQLWWRSIHQRIVQYAFNCIYCIPWGVSDVDRQGNHNWDHGIGFRDSLELESNDTEPLLTGAVLTDQIVQIFNYLEHNVRVYELSRQLEDSVC